MISNLISSKKFFQKVLIKILIQLAIKGEINLYGGCSSTGQSTGLWHRRLWVQVPSLTQKFRGVAQSGQRTCFGSRGSEVRILSPRHEKIPHVSDERALFHDKALFFYLQFYFLFIVLIIAIYNQIYPFGGHKSGGHTFYFL